MSCDFDRFSWEFDRHRVFDCYLFLKMTCQLIGIVTVYGEFSLIKSLHLDTKQNHPLTCAKFNFTFTQLTLC